MTPSVPILLLLESSTEVCSVGICRGDSLLAFRESDQPMQHAKNMAVFVDEVLRQSGLTIQDLHGVALSNGPGSYTGLRIGASLAKGISYLHKLPVFPISSLRVIAACAKLKLGTLYGDEWLVPMIDARRMEVYTGVYGSELETIAPDYALDLANFPQGEANYHRYFNATQRVIYCGNAVNKVAPALAVPTARFLEVAASVRGLHPLAVAAYHAGRGVDPAYFTPRYIKAPNITRSRKSLF